MQIAWIMCVLAALATADVPTSAPPILTLDGALKEAQARNPDLAQVREKLRQTKEMSSRVLANYLPQINVEGSYTRNEHEASLSMPTGLAVRAGMVVPTGSKTLTFQKTDQFAARGQITQALIVPSLWPAFKIADLGESLAAANVEYARREILFAVVQVYYGCVSLKEVVGIHERLLENNLKHEQDAQVLVEANAAPQIALLRAQIDRTTAEQELLNARASYASAKVALGTLLDRESDFDVVAPPEPEVVGTGAAMEERAERDRPDVRAARLSREIAERSAAAVRYSYAPNLVGTATYQVANLKGFIDSYTAWAVGVGLSWTIWDGGLRESQRRENASKVAEANEALRSVMAKVRDEVRRGALELEKARASRAKAEEKVKLARENMRLVDVAFQAGAATAVEVSDANTALAGAELSRTTETLNAQLAALKLARAAGAFAPGK
jgi:outer membrane protein TolC